MMVNILNVRNVEFKFFVFSGRPWIYQCCSEFGWLQSGSGDQPFGRFSNEFFLAVCNELFRLFKKVDLRVGNGRH